MDNHMKIINALNESHSKEMINENFVEDIIRDIDRIDRSALTNAVIFVGSTGGKVIVSVDGEQGPVINGEYEDTAENNRKLKDAADRNKLELLHYPPDGRAPKGIRLRRADQY